MRAGDQIQLTIAQLGATGDGQAHRDGQKIFVPLALAGEDVTVRIARNIGDALQAELLSVTKPSPARVAPVCPHFSHCGGCSLQHMGEQAASQLKQEMVQTALRQHGVTPASLRPIVSLPGPTRRRLTLAAVHTKDGPVLGYNARSSATVIAIQSCAIARPELMALLPELRTGLAGWIQSARALDLSLTLLGQEIDLLITGPEPDLNARMDIAQLPDQLSRISWRKSERSQPEPLRVLRTPILTLAGHTLAYPPGVFLQPSREGEVCLTQLVDEALLGTDGPVADLFAGIGTFSLPLATRRDVLAADSDGAALEALATIRHPRIKTERRDLFRDPLSVKELDACAAVVLDPPRAGAQSQCALLAQSRVACIAMVSCNPGTFARDARLLCDQGYRLDWVAPVDQFFWSTHTELVARFSRG